MTTGNVGVDEPATGIDKYAATFTISEDALTKFLQRIVLSKSDGTEWDLTAGTAGTPGGAVTTVQGVSGMTPVVAKTDQTTHGTTDLVAADLTKVAGTAAATGNGVVGAGVQRVAVASDNTAFPVKIDQTTPGTTNAVALTSGGFDVTTTITRPGNITGYTALDVLGGALDLGILGPSGGTIQINSVQLWGDIAAVPASQVGWELHLYSVTPPSALADNAAFDIPSGDRASHLGFIPITTLVDYGSTLYVEVNNVGKQVKLSGTHLFGYLKTVGGFTPAANSEVYRLALHTVAL